MSRMDHAADPRGTRAPLNGYVSQDTDLAFAVEAAQRGDEEAFRLLFRAVQPRLLRYLRGIVGDDAEDVASESWLQIARDMRSFQGDFDSFRGWAATIARHRALDHLRNRQRRPAVAVPAEHFADRGGSEDTEQRAIDAVSAAAAIAMIASLPRDQAEAVLLRIVMGFDAEAAGRVLGKRAGAVRTAAHRGLRRLAAQLERAEAADSALVRKEWPPARVVTRPGQGDPAPPRSFF